MRVLATILLLMLVAGSVRAADGDIAGQWSGTWTKNGDALPVTVNFAKGDTIALTIRQQEARFDTWRGTFDADAIQASAIPFAQVTFANGHIHFELIGDETASMFDGTLANGVLAGTFEEGAQTGTFQLARVAVPKPPLLSRDVSFANGDVKLAGTLVLPATPGRHAAIVFLHGSGDEVRWANHWLARKFAEQGVVALIYDKRGSGQSTGRWETSAFDDLAGDAVAAIRFLQAQPETDPAHVGIYGHSQGGTIAPLVAERAGDAAFVIASAASASAPIDLERYSVGNSMGIPDLPAAEKADAQTYLNEILDVAFNGKDRANLDALAVRFKARTWYFDVPGPNNSYWAFSRAIAGYRPLEHWRQVRAPVLLAYGARDARVPARDSASAIESTLRAAGNRRVTEHTWRNANHSFVIVDPPLRPGAWPKRVPDYAEVLTGWVQSLQ